MALSLSVFHIPCVLLGATLSDPASVNWKWEGEILTCRPLRVSCCCVPVYSRPRLVGVTDELLAHFPKL